MLNDFGGHFLEAPEIEGALQLQQNHAFLNVPMTIMPVTAMRSGSLELCPSLAYCDANPGLQKKLSEEFLTETSTEDSGGHQLGGKGLLVLKPHLPHTPCKPTHVHKCCFHTAHADPYPCSILPSIL